MHLGRLFIAKDMYWYDIDVYWYDIDVRFVPKSRWNCEVGRHNAYRVMQGIA